MRTIPFLPEARSLAGDLRSLIVANFLPDYVYSYPPRQCFRPMQWTEDESSLLLAAICAGTPNISLYLHFPFCRQTCGFCNLFTVPGFSREMASKYIDAILEEISFYSRSIPGALLRTVYFGGGTPSLLDPDELARVLTHIERSFPETLTRVEELCLEVAPDTLTDDRASQLASLGFTRVSIGAQTLSPEELRLIGRRYPVNDTLVAVEAAQRAGIRDICVDLICGLPSQTRESWVESVKAVSSLRPSTVCTYNLTSRPRTGFAGMRTAESATDEEKYLRYRMAQKILLEAGYSQETNVRYVIPGVGGYIQKVLHWGGHPVIGVGAGARTYSRAIHCINGYSLVDRRAVVTSYEGRIAAGQHARTEGMVVDQEELLRQRLVLGLNGLPVGSFGEGADAALRAQVEALLEFILSDGYGEIVEGVLHLTDSGFAYRDLFCNVLFSPTVRELVADYSY